VWHILNFTDVEDKVIAEAKKEGATLQKLASVIAKLAKMSEDLSPTTDS